jgi:hypothetical protein
MAFGPNVATAASRVPMLRPTMATLAPSATNRFAVANPMPLLPPVMSAALFWSCMRFLDSSGWMSRCRRPITDVLCSHCTSGQWELQMEAVGTRFIPNA